MSDTVDNPFFARLWTAMSAREPESLRRLRRENLADLQGVENSLQASGLARERHGAPVDSTSKVTDDLGNGL